MSKDKHIPGEEHDSHPPRPHRRRRRGFSRFLIRLMLLVILALAVLLGWNYYQERVFDLANPIKTDTSLSDEIVKEKLGELGDLVTSRFDYSNTREIKSSKQLGGWNIPGTTHTIQLKYTGHIKAGYTVEDIEVSVDNENRIIYVTLPEVKITDNYIDMDALSYSEQNNIFNPISGTEITDELDKVMEEELDSAINQGLYQTAEGSAQKAINRLLSEFSGFSVKFTNNQ